jgi:hypothetical protein
MTRITAAIKIDTAVRDLPIFCFPLHDVPGIQHLTFLDANEEK